MTVIARSEKYVILGEKRGEGTFGSVYTGRMARDESCLLAFKVLKEQDKLTGLVQHNNVREATFLAQISEDMANTPDNPFVMALDIISGDQLNVADPQSGIAESLIIVQPLYACDMSQIIQGKGYERISYEKLC